MHDDEIHIDVAFTPESTFVAGAVAVFPVPDALAAAVFQDEAQPASVLSIVVSNCADGKQFMAHTLFSVDGLAYLQAYIEEHVRTWTPEQQIRYAAKIDQNRQRCRETITDRLGRRP